MSIPLLSFVSLLSSLIFLFFIVFILYKNYKKTLNQVIAAYLVCFVFWSGGMFFVNNPKTTYEEIVIINKIDSIGWISFPVFFFLFVLLFTKNSFFKKNKKKIILLLFLPAIFFIIRQWQEKLIDAFVKTSYGWSHVWSNSLTTYSFYVYYTFFTLFPLFLLINFYKKSTNLLKRKQTKIIVIASIIPLSIGTFTNVILKELNIHKFPTIADISSLIWSFGIIYAMVKYRFLGINLSNASENIIETMSDGLILVDLQGNIITTNKSALSLSGYNEQELKSVGLNGLFMEDNFKEMLINKAFNGEIINNYNLLLITKKGENVPIIFSDSLLKDKNNNIIGIICIAKDITQLKKIEEQLQKRAWELETKIKELEKIQKLTVNREFRMMELKEENKKLKEKIEIIKNNGH